MDDVILTTSVYLVKLLRFSVIWISLFVVEKVYQDAYVSKVLIRDGEPPDLRPIVLYTLLVDFVFSVFVLVIVALLNAQNQGPTYAIDSVLAQALIVDYVSSTSVMAALGWGVATVVQDKKLLRYKDDGLRSIRALGTLILYGSLVTLLLPYYKLLM